MATSQEAVEKTFAEQDKRWGGPKYFVTGILTLLVCVSAIYYMSTFGGCSLQIVP
jgi:hypothetical protein